MSRLLIRDARIARPSGELYRGDLLCENGRIAAIDRSLQVPADEVVEADGHLLLPGVMDPQVHFREPGKEYKEDLGSGSRAAAKGGVTSFLEMPNTDPSTTNQAALDDKLARAAEKSVVNYGFFIGATPDNLEALQSVQGACGVKIFMGASTGSLLVNREEDLDRIFANVPKLIAVHAEDEARIQARKAELAHLCDPATHSQIRDNEAALLATKLALGLAKRYRRRLHVLHLSTKEEVALLAADKPSYVSAEAIPNHLFLNTDAYAKRGTLVQMNPPIRSEADRLALWQGLRSGTIDCIATDHAPHTLEEKALGFPKAPSGMPGVETSLPLMLTAMRDGHCTLAELQRWMCFNPARLYGVPNKGRIEIGWDADLVLVDMLQVRPVKNDEMFTKVRWSPFDGWELSGWPLYTVVGGQVVFARGEIRPGVRGAALQFPKQAKS
ncbi:MAG: dihydroorotase [Pseudomonadota bacterium]